MFTYVIGPSLYLNITNRCSNRCSFCVRDTTVGVGHDLWLEREPTTVEILAEITHPTDYQEIVFCGYGEPLVRLDVVIEVARALRPTRVPIRVNTNGQGSLLHGRNIVPELSGLIDIMSVSLNAPNSRVYQEICHSDLGEEAYAAVLGFIRESAKQIPKVIASVVDLPQVDLEACRKITEELGVEFRVRHMITDPPADRQY